ncbi:GntR family transcriptional regulator [Citricoccus sp. NPDC055426]|uniref:GntR family transcriptional regulator n=1 Tax=Citricoccus sp. NPDC055426 TaxID=3155536 RepID=UPI0034198FBA
MSAEITLDLDSPVPPFEQLRARITELVDDGTLAPGARLPSVRALASDLGIAVGTVARAYRELEAAGYVLSRRRHGTTVAQAPPGRAVHAEAPAGVVQAAEEFVLTASEAGFSRQETLEIVARAASRLGR